MGRQGLAVNDRAGAEPRLVAARALQSVLDGGQALDEALGPLLANLEGSRDRALARRLCHGVLRDWPALDALIRQCLDRPIKARDRLIHFLLAVAIHELRDAREPDHAIVHAAVEAAGRFRDGRLRGLVNAVLRGFQRGRSELQAGLADDPVLVFGYPGWLIDRIGNDWPEQRDAVLAAGNQPPPLWLRVNRRYWSRAQAREALQAAGHEAVEPAGFPDAMILSGRAAVSRLPGFVEGGLSVQDGAAQLVVEELQLSDGLRVLDACSAPGGKSAHILERASVDLTAVDIEAQRLERVGETLDRLGLQASLVTGDAASPDTWWDGEPFDRILIDAPCSATGVIRRHPDIRWLRRAGDVDRLAALQAQMLDRLWPLLRPGGILVYATCSILRVENVEQVRSFLERHEDARANVNSELPGRQVLPGRQLLPGDHDCDGFYCLAAGRLQPGAGERLGGGAS